MSSLPVTHFGHSDHAIAALIEGAECGMPLLLAHGGGQTKRAWKRLSATLAHLICGGSHDLVSPEVVVNGRELVRHAEYGDIADATHLVVGDRNDAFGDAILDFLRRAHGNGIAA
ncbi:MAG TPA: hypothetical protein PKC48_03560 [Sphingorhabdus sp.]|jgi:pimeloyl-ACP methyl ester carboxylesterase|uniref:hypothetical protein n=1 Tax=Sphingorhabdus sp. TaxID=1902408 RepID=UPI002633024E|nr:hypothetical protein [Sphingorhabdus sp.]HMS19792.1 hypothetical protein [Sphingorhabdus sp.]HMT40275.1 hypothetical protein [Sphingorhabdus sp.]HMU21336.1 hypothetical protein [Sphingorhabdus sp.]